MGDGIGFAEVLLGMPGFKITAVGELEHGELVVDVGTTVTGGLVSHLRCARRSARPHANGAAGLVVLRSTGPSTERAGVEACRLVGEQARSVAPVAKEFGVTWATVMGSVRRHGQPLIDDPERVGVVTGLGIDETSFLKGNAQHHIKLVTGFVVAWTRRDAGCRTRPSDIAAAKTIRCTGCGGSCSPVPTDSTSTARQGSCWACAPGDPHDEVTGAWLAKESVRDVYLADSRADAEALLDKTIIVTMADDVAEIRALASHGFRSFDNYRIRGLRHTGGIKWQAPRATPIRTALPTQSRRVR